jgi:catechol 2,3-dioxygenase
MADHLVSEAIYLTDPEGNGIEIYADRPHEGWKWDHGRVDMATLALDLQPIVASAGDNPAPYDAAPEGLRIGHVHLRVGNHAEAERWWTSEVGLQPMAHYPGATFLASGGYHHHIAGNAWQSRGAGPRDPKRSGLSWVELTGSGIAADRELSDPWGTVVRLRPGR